MNFEERLARQQRRDMWAHFAFSAVFFLVGACMGALATAVLL